MDFNPANQQLLRYNDFGQTQVQNNISTTYTHQRATIAEPESPLLAEPDINNDMYLNLYKHIEKKSKCGL